MRLSPHQPLVVILVHSPAHVDLSVCFERAVSHFPRVQKRRPGQDLPKPDSRLMP